VEREGGALRGARLSEPRAASLRGVKPRAAPLRGASTPTAHPAQREAEARAASLEISGRERGEAPSIDPRRERRDAERRTMGREGQRHAAPYREREVRCQKAIDREPNESHQATPRRERGGTPSCAAQKERLGAKWPPTFRATSYILARGKVTSGAPKRPREWRKQ